MPILKCFALNALCSKAKHLKTRLFSWDNPALKKFLFIQSNNSWVSPFSSSTTKMISGLRILVTFTALLSIIPSSIGNLAAKRYKSTCETNPADIHLTKGRCAVVILFFWYSLTVISVVELSFRKIIKNNHLHYCWFQLKPKTKTRNQISLLTFWLCYAL